MKVKAYTDGACSGNPGPGGWGVYLVAENNRGEIVKEETLYGKNKDTTNQIMELTAVIQALENLKRTNVDITIFTDSRYVVNGITKWIFGWIKNNWSTTSKNVLFYFRSNSVQQMLLVCSSFNIAEIFSLLLLSLGNNKK